jgi:hypothetical protein
VGGDPVDVYAAAAVLDHHQDVEAAEEDGVDVSEVDREDRVGLRGGDLSPGRAGPSRAGSIPAFFKIVHTVGGNPVAESADLDQAVAAGPG